MNLTREKAVELALIYVNAGKAGKPMPLPIKGKEIGCKNAYQLGEYYMMQAHNTRYEDMAGLKSRLCNESNE
jgi:hypothetical protein